jgi:hypothetical protein
MKVASKGATFPRMSGGQGGLKISLERLNCYFNRYYQQMHKILLFNIVYGNNRFLLRITYTKHNEFSRKSTVFVSKQVVFIVTTIILKSYMQR